MKKYKNEEQYQKCKYEHKRKLHSKYVVDINPRVIYEDQIAQQEQEENVKKIEKIDQTTQVNCIHTF